MGFAARTVFASSAALVVAGLITATPEPPPVSSGPAPAVELSSTFDPITPWVQTLQTAFNNSVTLGRDLVSPPVPVLQQVIVNQAGFLHDFITNPGSILSILREMTGNLATGLGAPFAPDPSLLDTGHQLAFAALSPLLPILYPDHTKLAEFLLNFTATPFSGWLLGELGTILSPALELRDSIGAIVDGIRGGDWLAVLNDVVNVPAHLVDGYLNGYGTVDLTDLAGPLLPTLPIGTIRSVSLDVPGLLSPDGTGLLWGAIGMDVCTRVPIAGCVSVPPFPIDGTGTGPIGSLIAMTHVVTQSIGWDGTGNPISALFDDLAPAGAGVADIPDGL